MTNSDIIKALECCLAQRVKETNGDLKTLYEVVQDCTKEIKGLIEKHFPAIEFAC